MKCNGMTLSLTLEPANPTLALRSEPQLCYVLVSLTAQGSVSSVRSVNWAVVADASRSMRIPIISEDQFRQLVREGGAHEVLVDGVPVWQFRRPVPPEIDANAPNALDYVARALASVVEYLQADDQFALVVYAEHAELLAPATSGTERGTLIERIDQLRRLHLGDETDLAQGMQRGLQELRRTPPHGSGQVARLLLLTDGFTRDPAACLRLARQAASAGISISTLGLGGDFQDDLLTALADLSGGRAVFLRKPEDIPRAVAHELSAARAVAARAVSLRIELDAGVALRRATSLSPTLAPLEPTTLQPTSELLHLGDLGQHSLVHLLLELLAPPTITDSGPAANSMRLAQLSASGEDEAAVSREVRASLSPMSVAPPASVRAAAARATAARLQRRALDVASQGQRAEATRLLHAAAARFDDLNETELAAIARHEAAAIEQTGQTTRFGAKELTYATRRMGTQENAR
jgi:hypothetical protein